MDTVVSAYGNKVKYKNEHSPETPPPIQVRERNVKGCGFKTRISN